MGLAASATMGEGKKERAEQGNKRAERRREGGGAVARLKGPRRAGGERRERSVAFAADCRISSKLRWQKECGARRGRRSRRTATAKGFSRMKRKRDNNASVPSRVSPGLRRAASKEQFPKGLQTRGRRSGRDSWARFAITAASRCLNLAYE